MAARILAVPIADRATASSRLRLHDLVHLLPRHFDTTVLRPRDPAHLHSQEPSRFDLLYVQKDATPTVVEFARRAADAGVPVVYDIDDDFGCWSGMDEAAMCELASLVTVDSQQRAAAVRPAAGGPVTVLPCMIDAATDPHRALLPNHPADQVRVVSSFGNLPSLRAARAYLRAVPPGLDTYVVGPAGCHAELGGMRVVAFRLDTFVRDLSASDVFLLAHGTHEAALKDNNRLIMGMSLGIPSLVSATPAYTDTLAELGLAWLACAPAEVPDRLGQLADPGVRTTIAAAGREYAWSGFSPSLCAARLAEALNTALDGPV